MLRLKALLFTIWPLIIITLLVMVFFWKFVLLGLIPVDADLLLSRCYPWKGDVRFQDVVQYNPEHCDPVVEMYPLKSTAIAAMKQGILPLWNPFIMCGTPLMADGFSSPFNPLNFVFFLFSFPAAWGWYLLLQFLLAGCATYLFARALELRKDAALIGAVAYMFNGFFCIWFEHSAWVSVFAYLPLTLFFIEKAFTTHRAHWALWAGISIGLQCFSGTLQAFAYAFVISAAYIVFSLLCNEKVRVAPLRSIVLAGGIIIIGSITALPQLAVAVELLKQISRNMARYGGGNFLHPAMVLTYMFPEFFGHPLDGNYVGDVITHRSLVRLSPPYIGILPLCFALVGITRGQLKKTSFFILISIGFVFVYASMAVPAIYRIITSVIPNFDTIDHYRYVPVISFGLAMLAAYGADLFFNGQVSWHDMRRIGMRMISSVMGLIVFLDIIGMIGAERMIGSMHAFIKVLPEWLFRHSHTLQGPTAFFNYLDTLHATYGSIVLFRGVMLSLIFLGIAYVLVIAFHRFSQPKALAGITAMMIGFIMVDLMLMGARYNPFNKPEMIYPATGGIEYVQQDRDLFRIAGIKDNFEDFLSNVFPANSAMMYGMFDVRGYESLNPSRYFKLVVGLDSGNGVFDFNMQDTPLADLLNVKYFFAKDYITADTLELVYDREMKVYRNTRVLPRAFFVPQYRVARTEEEALALMRSPELDAAHYVVLERSEIEKMSWMPAATGSQGGGLPADIVEYTCDKVSLIINAPQDGFLVTSEVFYPGWEAFVDGERVNITRGNYAFRVLPLKEGRHRVMMRYRPMYFMPCLLASLVVIIIGLISACVVILKAASLCIEQSA